MHTRLSAQRILSFVSSYSCNHPHAGPSVRGFSSGIGTTSTRSQRYRTVIKSSPSARIGKRRAFHSSAPRSISKDPYEVLGVKKDATPAEVKKTYFALARKYHPDTNPDKDAQAKFVEIQEAYDILKDEKKRANYDKYGAASQQQGFDPNAFSNDQNPFGGGFGGFGDFSQMFNAGASHAQADLFEQLFGAFGGGRRSRAGFAQNMQGDDIEATVTLNFLEACKGASRTVNITPVVPCSTCSGTGLKAGAKRSTCKTCHGTGTTTFVVNSGFHMASTCGDCHGTGTIVPRGSQCGECGGVGQTRTRKSVKVDIPAGAENGMVLRIPNAGDAPVSGKGQAGNLLVRVQVMSSKVFRRQGNNLYHDARIPLHTALLGGRIRVPTLDGDVDVRVPGGTQQGEEMILKGRGVPSVLSRGGDKGDLFVTFNVQLPRSLTKRQREILQQYADEVEVRTSTTSTTRDRGSTTSSPTSEDPGSKSAEPNENDHRDEEPEQRKRAAA
ncbi:hypothetical protein CERSUDRAFT_110187 [Gelatoporia subvermispora B]|uniref:DnaJ homolog 1, mitochondrial n=1 Tax=Ceriporiopsis subvermispora (strain B) TaxID=914234 RepID=M2RT45_CERS8|nr:hypothetical protein CERSUDRAFT_110187 [Gelatoporia subvermispora B]